MREVVCDVVVVGAGPAGATAAYHLAKSGVNVIVLEARPEDKVWGKPCGDAVAAYHFKRAELPEPPPYAIKNRVKGVKVYSPSKEVTYFIEGEGLIIDRRAYGSYLLRLAKERGAQVLFRAAAVEPLIKEGAVAGVRAVTPHGSLVVRAKLVVEATGTSRALVRKLPREWIVAEELHAEDVNMAYRKLVELEDDVDEPDVLRIYIDQTIAPGGYWWLFPEGRNLVNIGLGVQGTFYPAIRPSQRVGELLDALGSHYRVVEQGGAPVPTRRPLSSLVAPGLLVIGDAGYAVNPLHGGGMGYAFETGYLAARTAVKALEIGSASEEHLWDMNVAYMRGTGAKQAALDVFRYFLQKLSNQDIDFGMRNRLIAEADVCKVSSKGDLSPSVIERASLILRGLRRPSLLLKLKLVADYMKRVMNAYKSYPEHPKDFKDWRARVETLFREYKLKLSS